MGAGVCGGALPSAREGHISEITQCDDSKSPLKEPGELVLRGLVVTKQIGPPQAPQVATQL